MDVRLVEDYVRGNMEHPVAVSGVLEAGAGVYERQPGQGTQFGKE